ncbi:hypothetical protein Tco_0562019 [Tanacetum coccineum]
MGDDHPSIFNTEEIVPIPRESEEISRSDSKNVLPSCDDFSSIKVLRGSSVTSSAILFSFINDPPFEENEFETNDEAECFNPGGDNDEIDAFLAIKVPTYMRFFMSQMRRNLS